MKEFQNEYDEAILAKEEMANSAKEAERKLKNLEADNLQLQEDLAASERARKKAEAERDELQDEINNSGASKYVP